VCLCVCVRVPAYLFNSEIILVYPSIFIFIYGEAARQQATAKTPAK
jgi:hypothetical protein